MKRRRKAASWKGEVAGSGCGEERTEREEEKRRLEKVKVTNLRSEKIRWDGENLGGVVKNAERRDLVRK